jgi:hypothetical protein
VRATPHYAWRVIGHTIHAHTATALRSISHVSLTTLTPTLTLTQAEDVLAVHTPRGGAPIAIAAQVGSDAAQRAGAKATVRMMCFPCNAFPLNSRTTPRVSATEEALILFRDSSGGHHRCMGRTTRKTQPRRVFAALGGIVAELIIYLQVAARGLYRSTSGQAPPCAAQAGPV